MKKARRSIRLKGYDYSQSGAYFVTICVQNRESLFGNIVGGKMVLNEAGRIADSCWNAIPDHFPHVALDEYVIMPNHVHGILFITNHPKASVGAKDFSPVRPHGTSGTIGSVVRGFKIGVTKWFRSRHGEGIIWQRNYYEHIIRNDNDLNAIREYIICNPERWETDRENMDSETLKP